MIWRRRRLYYSHPVRTSRWSVALYFLFRNAKDYKDYVIILRRVGDTGNLGENIESHRYNTCNTTDFLCWVIDTL